MARIVAVIPDEHAEQLLAHARVNDRTLSAEIRRMTRMYLQALERPRPSVESVIESSSERPRQPIAAA